MGLVVRILRLSAAVLLRFSIILLVLFVAHLVIGQLLPHVRNTARLIEEAPLLEQRLRHSKAQLERHRAELRLLEHELQNRSKAQLAALRVEAQQLRQRVQDLAEDKRTALAELAEAKATLAEYCDTYNPFKLWFCSDMRQRYERLNAQLSPLIERVEGETERAEQRLRSVEKLLQRAAKDPDAAVQILREQAPQETQGLLERMERAEKSATLAQRAIAEAREQRRAALQARDSVTGWLLREWRGAWDKLVILTLTAMLLPYVQRVIFYFGLMPLIERAEPIHLSRRDEQAGLSVSEARRTLPVELERGQTLYVRPTYARPVEGASDSLLLYKKTAPFISYAAGLFMLTRLRAPTDKPASETSTTLAAPDDPDLYLMRLDLVRHPGLVIRPRQLVGVIGDLQLRTVWKPFSVHAWSTWQVRYILLAGTGSAIIEGSGDVVAERLAASRAKIEQKLVLGFDSQLAYRTGRTETFLPYLFGRAQLVDDVFEQTGTYFWQKSAKKQRGNVVERSFDALFSALGKLLGF